MSKRILIIADTLIPSLDASSISDADLSFKNRIESSRETETFQFDSSFQDSAYKTFTGTYFVVAPLVKTFNIVNFTFGFKILSRIEPIFLLLIRLSSLNNSIVPVEETSDPTGNPREASPIVVSTERVSVYPVKSTTSLGEISIISKVAPAFDIVCAENLIAVISSTSKAVSPSFGILKDVRAFSSSTAPASDQDITLFIFLPVILTIPSDRDGVSINLILAKVRSPVRLLSKNTIPSFATSVT